MTRVYGKVGTFRSVQFEHRKTTTKHNMTPNTKD